MSELEVLITFGKGITADVQGKAMLALERYLRELTGNYEIDVFKEAKGDDSKLRSLMTPLQRSKL